MTIRFLPVDTLRQNPARWLFVYEAGILIRTEQVSITCHRAALQRLSAQTAVLYTARMAYPKALQATLPAFAGDTMKFN